MDNHSIKEKQFRLWGLAGGELEFVSARIEWRQREDQKWYQVMILRFTDHDAPNLPLCGDTTTLIDGIYYETEMPIM